MGMGGNGKAKPIPIRKFSLGIRGVREWGCLPIRAHLLFLSGSLYNSRYVCIPVSFCRKMFTRTLLEFSTNSVPLVFDYRNEDFYPIVVTAKLPTLATHTNKLITLKCMQLMFTAAPAELLCTCYV